MRNKVRFEAHDFFLSVCVCVCFAIIKKSKAIIDSMALYVRCVLKIARDSKKMMLPNAATEQLFMLC